MNLMNLIHQTKRMQPNDKSFHHFSFDDRHSERLSIPNTEANCVANVVVSSSGL
jgi:hypothetical protein